ncbi:10305_t:CDS:2, partial [Dentiscutata erythropus]
IHALFHRYEKALNQPEVSLIIVEHDTVQFLLAAARFQHNIDPIDDIGGDDQRIIFSTDVAKQLLQIHLFSLCIIAHDVHRDYLVRTQLVTKEMENMDFETIIKQLLLQNPCTKYVPKSGKKYNSRLNEFFVFRTHIHGLVKTHMIRIKATNLSKIVGKIWQEMTYEEKHPYRLIKQKALERYQQDRKITEKDFRHEYVPNIRESPREIESEKDIVQGEIEPTTNQIYYYQNPYVNQICMTNDH